MRRIVLLGAIGLMIAGSAAAGETVVATHAVYAEFAQTVAGEDIDVVSIIPSGFCPSHYDLAPSDLAAVLDAGLILYSGFETWIETLVGAAGSAAVVMQLPGAWSTPDGAIDKVEAIRDALIDRFPDLAATFAANAAAYIDQLREAGDDLQQRAEAIGVASVAVICMEWQADFVSWLGFDVAGTYGVPEGLSLKDLVALSAMGRDAAAQLVIDNLQSGVDFGAKLAREVGAIHVVLSNFPGAMPYTTTVIDLLTRNAEALFSAIEPLE
ncbi:metal ABC transporter substrate-binding protein [Candidatus Bipolaricaulota bacterium]